MPETPDRDITYIRTRSGWLYLAAVLDLFSRKIVGWATAPNMPAELVCTALQMAIAQRQPKAGLVVHTDRGSQYASAAHRQVLMRHGLIGSMSRKGNCWDNAVMERFFLNLKRERVWQQDYANHGEAIKDITEYIVGFYNWRQKDNLPRCLKVVDHYMEKQKAPHGGAFRKLAVRESAITQSKAIQYRPYPIVLHKYFKFRQSNAALQSPNKSYSMYG